jgi:hypothetical protein
MLRGRGPVNSWGAGSWETRGRGSRSISRPWRTNFQVVWDIRKRMQWCMLPLGTNMLPADAPEYADLELYLTAFDQGKPMNVPGIRH